MSRLRKPLHQYHYDDPEKSLPFLEKWSPLILGKIGLYLCVCLMGTMLLQNTIWDANVQQFTYVIGILGIWRYAWWMTHAVRARIFAWVVYPRMAARATALWDSGWRPRRLHFMMTTYNEERDITEAVIRGIVAQVRDAGVPPPSGSARAPASMKTSSRTTSSCSPAISTSPFRSSGRSCRASAWRSRPCCAPSPGRAWATTT